MSSTSWHFESQHQWSGLLVEPLPQLFRGILARNRTAWAVNTCLSTNQRPETINFGLQSSSDQTMSGIVTEDTDGSDAIKMQCLPLYSLLLALGNPTVDFLSLDIEGAEYKVLLTIPWEKVNIRTLSVETQFAGDLMEGSRKDIISLLTGAGFTHMGALARDDIFFKLPAGQSSPAVQLRDVAIRTPTRWCEFFMVSAEQVADHCRLRYPRDYMRPHLASSLPPCLQRTQCPWTLPVLANTMQMFLPWQTVLGYNCQIWLFGASLIETVQNLYK